MENNKTVVSSGIGFGGLLTIVFITLKLTGVISWSWVWVLFPLWIPVALIFAICILCIAGVLIKLLRANKA